MSCSELTKITFDVATYYNNLNIYVEQYFFYINELPRLRNIHISNDNRSFRF